MDAHTAAAETLKVVEMQEEVNFFFLALTSC